MLISMDLGNFRIFNNSVHLNIKPITILIGKNSSGKSSIIKFLLMLKQSLSGSNSCFFVSEGNDVHLGAFPDLRNSKSKKQYLHFKLNYKTGELPPKVEREFRNAFQNAKPTISNKKTKIKFDFTMEIDANEPHQEVIADYEVSGEIRYSQKPQRGSHNVIGKIQDTILIDRSSNNLEHSSFLSFNPDPSNIEEVMKNVFTDRYLDPIRDEIRLMRHLSAIREESQRAIVVSSPPPDSVGSFGEYTMPHLHRLMEEEGEQLVFIMKHLENIANIDKIKFDSSMKGYLAHCKAINKETGASSYVSDFGFGVGQCIPVIVQGALMKKDQLLLVEQPEAQLHPTAQLEMGSYFVDLWKTRNVPCIIETHSSNILLRIRRLVKEKVLLPEEIAVAYFNIKNGMPVIDNLGIMPDGNIEDGLPMEFFGSDILESLLLGV